VDIHRRRCLPEERLQKGALSCSTYTTLGNVPSCVQ
jgi:hypothetical protein